MTEAIALSREELTTRFTGVLERVFDIAAADEGLSRLFGRILGSEQSRRVHERKVGTALASLACGDTIDYQKVANWHFAVGGTGKDGRPSEVEYDTVMGAIVTVASETEPLATGQLTAHLTEEVAANLREAVVYGRVPEPLPLEQQ
ncbi:MAG TPA: hypothetical protein VFM05_06160 [Candidatus Saccharimonadales bacterium]|nr:hypothetical protein [Candidatus Saccharimonadales bacterium]